ncbi:hypothetical protein Tco_1017192 [Tanacetum coccineum]|uniref:Uncharacterized protein n=1 Tax=Tanacetum coccineum TaxID=301880 RepID=A0ABQ5FSS8_9ASTR
MAQENRKSSRRYTSHHEHHHKEDSKNTLEDSWNDSSEDEREETCLMVVGSPKVHLNLSCSNKALSIENLQDDNFEFIELNEDFIKRIKALLKEKRILQEETNKLTNKANELEAKIRKDIKVKEVEFQRITLTGFRSFTSRSHYRSVSKQTTRACLMLALEGFPSSL